MKISNKEQQKVAQIFPHINKKWFERNLPLCEKNLQN